MPNQQKIFTALTFIKNVLFIKKNKNIIKAKRKTLTSLIKCLYTAFETSFKVSVMTESFMLPETIY